jgi:ankyrin repeat protein
MSALFVAISKGDLESVKRLVAEGADPKQTNATGLTALLWAANYGRIPIMHWLLTEGGSSLAEKASDGGSALSCAALGGHFAAMQYLLEEHGASMTESDNSGTTAWDYFPRSPRRGSAELSSLLKVVMMLGDAPAGFTPFLWAASDGRIPIMHWLLTEGGSSLAEQTSRGESALSLAALGGHFAAMQYLLEEHGAPMIESDNFPTAWTFLRHNPRKRSAELSSLLKVMVMLGDAPADYIVKLSPRHAKLCTRGRRLRARLPSYLEQQWATVVAHCPLPAVLQSVVAAYAAPTSEDMWAGGLRV